MNTRTKRAMRLALLTVALVGLFVAVTAIPGAATPPSGGFKSELLSRGTYVSHGTLPLGQGEDIVVSKVTIPPGGSSGWHSHPGGAIVVVSQGTVTFYTSVGNHCDIATYTKGQSFVERPGEVGEAVNKGATDYIAFATLPGVPLNGSPRIDENDPGTCPV